MHSKATNHTFFLLFLTAITAVRLLVIPHFGLGVDEAHYVLYGRYLDLSYFDHPPLVGWVQYLFTTLFGENEFGARLAAVLVGTVTSLLVYRFLFTLTKNSTIALLSTIALNSSFIFGALFIMLMPDTLLYLFIIPIIYCVAAIRRNNSVTNWLALGCLLGFAGLTKYTAILFLAPIVLYFILRKRFDLLITPKMLPAIVLAAVIVSPVLLWNMQHDWISFTYQAQHVAGSSIVSWENFSKSLLTQFAAYSPFLFPLAFFGLFKALRSKDDLLFISGLFGLTIFLFFSYASLYERALPHWQSPFFLLFIPIGSAFVLQAGTFWKKYFYGALLFSLTLSLFAYAELAIKFLPLPDYKSLHRDIYGFDTIMREANNEIDDPEQQGIAVTNWTLGSRALYYNSDFSSDVYMIDNRYDQFDFWTQTSPVGKDLLFINTHFFNTNITDTMQCDKVEHAKTLDIVLSSKVNTVDYVWCRNFQGRK